MMSWIPKNKTKEGEEYSSIKTRWNPKSITIKGKEYPIDHTGNK